MKDAGKDAAQTAPAATAAIPAVPAPVARTEGANVISASSKNITRVVTPPAAAAEAKK
jgi:hypothetical protein